MIQFRVFVQDRPRGMYSGYCEIQATDAPHAVRKARSGDETLPKLYAVQWPPNDVGNRWIKEHVG